MHIVKPHLWWLPSQTWAWGPSLCNPGLAFTHTLTCVHAAAHPWSFISQYMTFFSVWCGCFLVTHGHSKVLFPFQLLS